MAYPKDHLDNWVFDASRHIPDLPALYDQPAEILPPEKKAALPPPEIWIASATPVTSAHENIEISEPAEKLRALEIIAQQHASTPWDRQNRLQAEFIAKQERDIHEKSTKIMILEAQAAGLGASMKSLRRHLLVGAAGLVAITVGGTVFATAFVGMRNDIATLQADVAKRVERERDAAEAKARAAEEERNRLIAQENERKRVEQARAREAEARRLAERDMRRRLEHDWRFGPGSSQRF